MIDVWIVIIGTPSGNVIGAVYPNEGLARAECARLRECNSYTSARYVCRQMETLSPSTPAGWGHE